MSELHFFLAKRVRYINIYAMNRVQFIKRVIGLAVIGIPTITFLESCYKEEEEPVVGTVPNSGRNGDCLANGTSIIIGANHGHELTVSKADVKAGVEKSYSIQGSSSHLHTVIITSSDFASLKNNNSMEIESSNSSGHAHLVFVSCA